MDKITQEKDEIYVGNAFVPKIRFDAWKYGGHEFRKIVTVTYTYRTIQCDLLSSFRWVTSGLGPN